MKIFKNPIFIFLCLMMTVGFRPFATQARWPVDTSNPKLWVNFCSRPTMTTNNLPGDDPLYGQALTFTSITQSVLDDYNAISTTFVKLYDAATDGSYSAAAATNKTINICFTTTSIGASGETGRIVNGGVVTGCTIRLDSSLTSNARGLISTLTHELGHCMGLDHPHDTTNAVMSYFSSSRRLQIDDKAGITFLYPTNPNYSVETSTFGLSCAPK